MHTQLANIIPNFSGKRIVIIGDLILDEYLLGNATRMSREAPIPVLEFESRRLIPGGAANPATNIVSMGGVASQIGVIGDDEAGRNLSEILQKNQIDTSGVIIDPSRPTTSKMRVMAQMGLRFPQQVARMDTLSREDIDNHTEKQLYEKVNAQLTSVDAILFSDYHAGLLTESLIGAIRESAKNNILTADAQGSLEKYAGFTLVKCNADDAQEYLRKPLHNDSEFATAAQILRERLKLTGAMVITRGADGATVATIEETYHCPAPAVSDVYDTVGAGDTAIAVLTLAIISGANYQDAAILANTASGLVVRRVGNYAPTQQELLNALKA
ncbi:MAG: bifunctional ADP-heptose synthase [Aggregatilineales bacterium]